MKDFKFNLFYFFGVMIFAGGAGVLIGQIEKKNKPKTFKFDEEYHILVQENELLHSKKATLEREITIYKMLIIPAYDSLLNVNNVKRTKDFPKYKKMLHFK